MREIELCMKYADNCKRCPLNKRCEEEYQREMDGKVGECGGKRPGDMSILWGRSQRTPMPKQKEPSKER